METLREGEYAPGEHFPKALGGSLSAERVSTVFICYTELWVFPRFLLCSLHSATHLKYTALTKSVTGGYHA